MDKYYSDQAKGYLNLGVRQKGSGLGSVLATFGKRYALPLISAALPYLKKGAEIVGKEALSEGKALAEDLFGGGNFRASVKKRAANVGRNSLRQVGRGKKRKPFAGLGGVAKRKKRVYKKKTLPKISKTKKTSRRKVVRSVLSR